MKFMENSNQTEQTENSVSCNRIQRALLKRHELSITQCTANRNTPVTNHKYLTDRLQPAKQTTKVKFIVLNNRELNGL